MKIAISAMESVEVKRSPVLDYVVKRLVANVPDYMLGMSDYDWLNEINRTHKKKPITNASVVEAVRKTIDEFYANAKDSEFLLDPWELIIDAGICNTKCEPL